MQENRHKRWYDLFGLLPSRLGRLLMWLSIIPITFIIILLVYAWRADQYDLNEILAPLENCVVYDAQGRLIGTLTDNERVYAGRQQLPNDLVNAFVAREDEEFFDHSGIVYSSIIRSICRNVTTMSYAQGASTITMQLARNCYELGGKTIDRKVLEMAVARRIEEKYTKDEILTAYLNRIYFGQQCYGIAQAAERYFGKQTKDLTLAECATLAGLVRGPSIYNPVTNAQAATKVRNETLDRMLECEFITPEEHQTATAEQMTLNTKLEAHPGSYPVMYVSAELSTHDVVDQQEDTSSILVMSSFDLDRQRMIEDLCEPKLTTVERAPEWNGLPKRDGNNLKDCLQVAVLCLDAGKGEIMAAIGGRTALDSRDRWQNMVKPGCLFAPVVNICAVDQGRSVIRKSPEVTGEGVGFTTVIETAQKAGYAADMPRAIELYKGEFYAPLSQVVTVLYRIWKNGRNMQIYSVRQVGTTRKNLVMSYTPSREVSYQELLPRECAQVVAALHPYKYVEKGRKTLIDCALPDNTGHFAAVMSPSFAIFVWLGFDHPNEAVYKKKGVNKLLANTCSDIRTSIYTRLMTDKQKKDAELKKAEQEVKKKEAEEKKEA